MKKSVFKVFLIHILVLCLACTTVGAFSDVDVNTDEGKAIMKMQSYGYIQGVGDGRFLPQNTLTRAEFVTIINKMYDFKAYGDNIFKDIAETDWYYKDVLAAVQAGYIKGMGDGTFKPNQSVTREQVCVMLNGILKTERLPISVTINDEVSDWARESVECLVSNRLFILEDGGIFRATKPITRSEACVALEKCIIDKTIDIKPIDLESMAREELEKKLEEMIKIMETKIIPNCTYEKTIYVANAVNNSMKKYLKDSKYDYVSDAKATYEVYRTLSKIPADELRGLIYNNVKLEDISIMLEFFHAPEISE